MKSSSEMRKNYFLIFSIILICILFMSLIVSSVEAITPKNFNFIRGSIINGTEGLIWEQQNPNIYYVYYTIQDFNTTEFNYYIRVYSNYHNSINEEILLINDTGKIKLKTNRYESGTYFINLQREIKEDEITYCNRNGYPCEIVKNLDISKLNLSQDKKGDDYLKFIDEAMNRGKINIRGIAWINR